MSRPERSEFAITARVLRLKSVMKRTGLSRSTLYSLMNPESKYYDPTFPRRICLTGKAGGAVGFIESELVGWIESRVAINC